MLFYREKTKSKFPPKNPEILRIIKEEIFRNKKTSEFPKTKMCKTKKNKKTSDIFNIKLRKFQHVKNL